MKMPENWFFPIQEKVNKYLNGTYKYHICQYQDISKERVFENYLVTDNNDYTTAIIIVMRKFTKDFSVYKYEF